MLDTRTHINIFKPSPVFEWNYNSTADLVVNQGGTNSGKTYSILQVLIMRALKHAGTDTLVVGQDMPNMKIGVIRDMRRILENKLLAGLVKDYNATDKRYMLKNGSSIQFKVVKDYQDAKSGKREFLFINEANGISLAVFKELYDRTTIQTFIDFNPTALFWAHTEYQGTAGTEFLYSNFTHNPFLHPKIKRKILAYRKTDPLRWKVYGLGQTGSIEGVIFKNVRWIDSWPKLIDTEYYGIDFGYTQDPTACVRTGRLAGELYIELLLYEDGLNAKQIAEHVRPLRLDPYSTIQADSADPRLIADIAGHGISITGVKKPTIESSILSLLEEPVINIVANKNAKFEQQNYTWKYDKTQGRYINKPIDKYNHMWDAVRYSREAARGGGGIIASAYI